MKKKKSHVDNLFKSKTQMVFYITLALLILFAFIYLGNVNFDDGTTDAEIFSAEFTNVPEDNVYIYKTTREVYASILEEDVILFMGSNLNEWTEEMAVMVNEVAKETGIEEIIYYDFFEDRDNNNGNYELIVDHLEPYLYENDKGNKELHAPTLIVKKDGVIKHIEDSTNYVKGNITPDEYWTNVKKIELKNTLSKVFNEYLEY